MSLKTRLQEDMKTAMRARDTARLGVVRMALAAIQQREVDERAALSEADLLSLLEKMIKQRRESAEQYQAGGRPELADKELAETDLLSAYLPKPLDEHELASLIDAAISETGASGMRDMGRVMGLLKSRAAGRADMSALSAQVKARLSG